MSSVQTPSPLVMNAQGASPGLPVLTGGPLARPPATVADGGLPMTPQDRAVAEGAQAVAEAAANGLRQASGKADEGALLRTLDRATGSREGTRALLDGTLGGAALKRAAGALAERGLLPPEAAAKAEKAASVYEAGVDGFRDGALNAAADVIDLAAHPVATGEALGRAAKAAGGYVADRAANPGKLEDDAGAVIDAGKAAAAKVARGYEAAAAKGEGAEYVAAGIGAGAFELLPQSKLAKVKYAGRIGEVTDSTAAAKAEKLSKQPDHNLDNALKGFSRDTHHVGDSTFRLEKDGLKHILKRHHPDMRADEGRKKGQTDFHKSVTPDDVRKAVGDVLHQNRDALSGVGQKNKTVVGWVEGQPYQLSVNQGEVKQLYPMTQESLRNAIVDPKIIVALKPMD